MIKSLIRFRMDKAPKLCSTVITLAALTVCGCASVQNPTAFLTKKDTIENFNGKFVDSVDRTKISYESVDKKRRALTEEAGSGQRFLAERFVGTIDKTQISPDDTPIYDPEIEAFINSIIKKLLAHWPGHMPSTRVVFIAALKGEQQFQVKAAPDGTIFFSIGAIRDMDSTDEVAFIVGHELAHILLNHFALAESQAAMQDAMAAVVALATVADGLKSGGMSSLNGAAGGNQGNLTEYATLGGAGVNALMDEILAPAWGREQEREADLLSADLSIKAGFNPRGSDHVMQRLEDQERKNKVRADAERKRLRDEKLSQQRQAAAANGKIMLFSGEMLTSPLEDALSGLLDNTKSTHPEIKDRKVLLNKYSDREYRSEKRSRRTLREQEYQSFLVKVADGPLMRNQYAIIALQHLEKGQFNDAYSFAQRSLENQKDTSSIARTVLYQIRRTQFDKSGNTKFRDEAIKHLEIAWSGPQPSEPIALALANEYMGTGRRSDAEKLMKQAGDRLGNAEKFYVARLLNLFAAGKNLDAFALYSECQKASPPVRSQCGSNIPETEKLNLENFMSKRAKAAQALSSSDSLG